MTARLFVTLTLVLGAVALGELAGPSGWRITGDASQAIAGAAAAWVCLAAAARRTGMQRRWRRLAGVGLLGWTLMRLWWLVMDIVDPGRPVTSAADFGFLILPACLLLALLTAPYSRPRPVPTSPRRDQVTLLIDSVLVAGSLLALAWSTVPDRLMEWTGQNLALIGMAAAYPIADLVLLMMVVLLLATRPDAPAGRRPLQLVGLSLIAFGISDTMRLACLAELPLSPLESAGQLLGPALLAIAAATPTINTGTPPATGHRARLAAPPAPVRAGHRDRHRDRDQHRRRASAHPVRGVPRLARSRPGRGPADAHHRGQHRPVRPGLRGAAAAAPPGLPRPAHRPGQPRAVPRAAGARPGRAPAPRQAARPALRRPRRLQADQRQLRPRDGRPGAARHRRTPAGLRVRRRPGGPARWRRVRGGARPPSRRRRTGRSPHPGRAARAVRHRRPPHRRGRQHRPGGARPRRVAVGGRAAAPRGRRDVREQAARQGRAGPVRGGDRRADRRPAAPARPGPGDRRPPGRGRVRGLLPADRPPHRRGHGRGRGAGPLDVGGRPGAPGRLRHGGRADRPGGRHRRLRPRPGLLRRGDAGHGLRPADRRARQRVGRPPRPGRHARAGRPGRAGPPPDVARPPGHRDHRNPSHPGPRVGGRGRRADPADGRTHRARRLRQRVQRVGPVARAAAGHRQARLDADRRGRIAGAGRGGLPVGPGHLRRDGHRGGGRGHRDTRPGSRAGAARLPARAGLPVRPARPAAPPEAAGDPVPALVLVLVLASMQQLT